MCDLADDAENLEFVCEIEKSRKKPTQENASISERAPTPKMERPHLAQWKDYKQGQTIACKQVKSFNINVLF